MLLDHIINVKQMIYICVNMSKVLDRILSTSTSFLRCKYIQNFAQCTSAYSYEIPEHYQKSFYLANASLHENINWYLHSALEVSFDKFVQKIKNESPSFNQENVTTFILNRIALLDSCTSVLELNVPVTKDCGKVEIVKGFCARHGLHEKLHLGSITSLINDEKLCSDVSLRVFSSCVCILPISKGITLNSNLEQHDVEGYASLATYKHAIGNLPCFGAHCGIQIDPAKYSTEELKRLLSTFISTLVKNNFFGNQRNIFENELNLRSDMHTWIIEEYSKIKGNTDEEMSFITGKPVMNNGLLNYKAAIGDGIIFAMEYFLKCEEIMNKIGLSTGWCDKTYIIKGLGEISTYVVEILAKTGCKCIGIIEENVSVYDKRGIDVQEALEHYSKHGTVANYLRIDKPSKTLAEECDILILTEATKSLGCYSAPNVKAKFIVETTTGAITPTAHKILVAKGHLVLPDLLMKSISSIASFLEYTKCLNITENFRQGQLDSNVWYEQDVIYPYGERRAISGGRNYAELTENFDHAMINSVIQTITRDSASRIIKILEEYNLGCDIRTAAYILAVENIFEKYKTTRPQ